MQWLRSLNLTAPPHRIKHGLLLAGIFLTPAYIVFQFVQRYAVNVPFHDTWTLWLYDYAVLPHMSFSDALSTMWILQNEHRILLPRLILLPLSYLTHLHLPAIMIASIGLLLLLLAVLLRALWRTDDRASVRLPIAAVLSALTFALTASDRYINENAFPIFFAVLMSVTSLYFLASSEERRGRGWVSLVAAIAAALSFSSGYVTLLIGLLYLLIVRSAHRSRLFMTWVAVSALLVGLYVIELVPKLQFIGESTLSPDVRIIFLSVLRQIGSPLSPAWPVPAIFGLVPVLLFAAIAIPSSFSRRIRTQSQPGLFWVMLGLWALITVTLAAFGRSGVQGDGTPTRYFIYGQVFQVALVMTAVQASRLSGLFSTVERTLKPAIIAAALLFPTSTYAYAAAHLDIHSEFRIEREFLSLGYRCLRSAKVTVHDLDCVRPLFFNTITVNLMAPYVYNRGISTLRQPGSTAGLFDFRTSEGGDQEMLELTSQLSPSSATAGRSHTAISGTPLIWNVALPQDAAIRFESDIRRSGGSEDMPVTFEVLLTDDEGQTETLFTETLTAEMRQEVAVSVDLGDFAGQVVSLSLQASSSAQFTDVSGYWIEPRLVGTTADRGSTLLTLPAELVTGESRTILLPEGYRTYDHAGVPPFSYQQISISSSLRHAIAVPDHREITWRFHIPPASQLRFRTELYAPPAESVDPTAFRAEIEIRAGYSVTQTLYSEVIQQSFEPVSLEFDLSQYAGVLPSSPLESVVLTLRVLNAGEPTTPVSEFDILAGVFWVEPTLIHTVPALLASGTPDNVILIRP